MFSFFGKSTKKSNSDSPSTPSAVEATEAAEDDFTVVEARQKQSTPAEPPAADRFSFPGYPAVPAVPDNLPAYNTGTLASQSSVGGPHPLDGVPFRLGNICKTGDKSSDQDKSLVKIQECIDRAQRALSSSDYDFRLERTVMQQDINVAMRRLQT